MRKKSSARARLFVGSSQESLEYAYAIQENLDDHAEVTVWDQGIFELTKTSLESLVKALDKCDFAVFVFSPTDTVLLRKTKQKVVRDNVIFELGLFMGKLGRDRTFVVVPKGISEFRIPTDLAGVTTGEFNPRRNDKNLKAAFGPFCNKIRAKIKRKPKLIRSQRRPKSRKKAKPTANLQILRASYGHEHDRVDVTKQLHDAVADDKLSLTVGNQIAGDPVPGTVKDLIVAYRHNNKTLEKTVVEGAMLNLP
jgi:hypothetical protein